jgi:predicted acylesterase/phospholipase RssA
MTCIGLAIAVLPATTRATDEQPAVPAIAEVKRPRIGLVLSGGGARGGAHVGVIRVLENMQIPIDAVAGTSMGAVVGGLYAAGLSGAEIENVFSELDWQEMIRDRAPRRDLAYRRKQDDRNILARGAVGVREDATLVLPLGLVQGHKITQVLRAATVRVADVQDFDQLPTPFRALATDLETGEPVVMGKGDLVTVLRASMSAPGVLTPVQVDGRLLVDGGLVDNLPVDLARRMGVDRLIVVDVSFPLAKRDGLGSAFDITNQMLGIMVRRGTLESKQHLRTSDVLIEPNLGAMTRWNLRACRRWWAKVSRRRMKCRPSSQDSHCLPRTTRVTSRHARGQRIPTCRSLTCGQARVRPTSRRGSRRCSVISPANRSTRLHCRSGWRASTGSTGSSPSITA